ncbi:hypothetical protein V6Z11_D10G217200 [Gossypium hirsutum]
MVGNVLPLRSIPEGAVVCNVEHHVGDRRTTLITTLPGISGAPQDNNIMLWNAVIFGLDDTPLDGGNKVNNIDDYYFDYLWCEDYKYIKVIFSDCRETSASQPRVHEDWITRNVADVVCIVFFITKIYLIKKMHCIFYYLAMCKYYFNIYDNLMAFLREASLKVVIYSSVF